MNGKNFGRVILVVLDSVGIGAMPDAEKWGDVGADTLGNILKSRQVYLPNLQWLGIGNIREFDNLPKSANPRGSFGRCTLKSNGKDTTTGHWEIAGIVLEKAFPTYPNGFPPEIINEFVNKTNVAGILGNVAASGTEIIKQFGAEHIETGKPIVYTSADSVFQIAAHENVISIEKLYKMCETAREVLRGEHEVGRVIARPFVGASDVFTRTENRHDYAVPPPSAKGENLLVTLQENGLDTICVGKIASVYCNYGVTREVVAKNNEQGINQTINAVLEDSRGLIFTNLVDFDMLFGHRRDVEGYARALEHFDSRLPEITGAMRDDDLLIITADHGNDPTHNGSDHTREYTPLLTFGKHAKSNVNLGTRETLADIGQTIADNFDLQINEGESFLSQIALESYK
ncbi:MAG: phosphopentomutase [Pyrinomonadaceae bacterium]|nr:phosphopentomutase [Pyrinomonadaceae bacterium]